MCVWAYHNGEGEKNCTFTLERPQGRFAAIARRQVHNPATVTQHSSRATRAQINSFSVGERKRRRAAKLTVSSPAKYISRSPRRARRVSLFSCCTIIHSTGSFATYTQTFFGNKAQRDFTFNTVLLTTAHVMVLAIYET